MRPVLLIATMLAACSAPAFADEPKDTLTDSQLADYAAKLFKGDPSVSPPRYDKPSLTIGVHHGVEVVAEGVPCINCVIGAVAIYYRIPADSADCRRVGGQPVRYLARSNSLATDLPSRWERLCVPGVLVRSGLVGDGKPDDGREQAALTDDGLIALAQGMLDINSLGQDPDLPGRTYHGQRLAFARGGLGQAWTIRFDLAPGVSCTSVGGVVEKYDGGDITASYYDACIPKVLVDRKLDRGLVVLGPEFTDESLKAFAEDFFRHVEYRKFPPRTVQSKVAGTYRGWWVATTVLCDVVGSAEPQCLQADAPLIVSLAHAGAPDCPKESGVFVRYDVPNEYKPIRVTACMPKILLDADLWKRGVAPATKAEVVDGPSGG